MDLQVLINESAAIHTMDFQDCVLSDFPYSCKGDVTKNRELRRELGGYPLHVVND